MNSVNALRRSRIGWGFWLVVQTVISSVGADHCATQARGSIAFAMSRWLVSSRSTMWSASAKAWSQASLSPIDHSKLVFSGISS